MQDAKKRLLLDGTGYSVWINQVVGAQVLAQARKLFLMDIGEHIHVWHGSGQAIDRAGQRADEHKAHAQMVKTVEQWEQGELKIGRLEGPIPLLLDMVAKQRCHLASIFACEKVRRTL